MKRTLLLCFSFLLSVAVIQAQTFFDDFENYNDGDLISAASTDWDTWSGTPGGADDAPVSTEQAYSGYNSLKLDSPTPTGGPADVVLHFGGGQTVTTGTVKYSMWMYVVGGTGAYFNFQGVEPVGTTWATDFFFDDDGTVRVNTGATEQFRTTYAHDEWFYVELSANLDANDWQVKIGDRCIGSYANGQANTIASIDLFPYNPTGTSTYYVDDVAYSVEATVTPNVDVAISKINVRTIGLTGQTSPVTGEFTNLGTETITSIDVVFDDGTNQTTEPLTGLSVAQGESYPFALSNTITIEDGSRDYVISLENPNGGMDENECNSQRATTVTGVTPAPDKAVVLEEATGTWCPWCPRGAVFLDSMVHAYPDHAIGIAVHGGSPSEPMAIFDTLQDGTITRPYDAGIAGLPGFSGYPNMASDRSAVFNPTSVEGIMLQRLTTPASAVLENGAQWDADTRQLDLSLTCTFKELSGGAYRLGMVLTEDGVTGDNALYNQANAYAGGANGPMGGYEDLPNPVPFTDMVYDDVARALLGGFGGVPGVIPTSVDQGDSFIINFSFKIPDDFDENNMHIVGLLINPDGTIHNAIQSTIPEAIDNGFSVSINPPVLSNHLAEIFPNPTKGAANIKLQLDNATNVFMEVYSISGAKIASRDYGSLSGNVLLPFEGSTLENGMYIVHIKLDEGLITKKITLNR